VWIKGDIEMAVINTNIASLNAQNNLMKSQNELQTSLQRLSSGLRINSAKDDAAGLQISNRLTSQINGLNVATRNANDGISLAQTAEGAMQESTNILQRMRELALQSSNGSNSDEDRASLQKEVDSLQEELTRIAKTTAFGGRTLLDGTFGTAQFQVGSNANETISVSLNNIESGALGQQSLGGAGTVFGIAAAAGTSYGVATATDLTVSGYLGTSAATDVSGKNAQEVAEAVNTLGTGVTAEASVSVTLANFSSADTGTLEIGDTSYDLSKFNGSLQELATAIGKDGYDATYDSSTGKLSISATGVAGIKAVGPASGSTLTLDSVAVDDGGVVKNSELTFTSSEAFTLGGTITDIVTAAGASSLDAVKDINIKTASGSQDALAVIDAAIASIDSQRADLGAVQNRFESTISNLTSIAENVTAARSRIQDADFAQETANLTRNQILQQAGTSILAQANQLPQQVLSLLQ
jgi:flagellin